MPTISDLLHQINQQHATSFVLLDRYATGEQGAFALSDAADDPEVQWASKWRGLSRPSHSSPSRLVDPLSHC